MRRLLPEPAEEVTVKDLVAGLDFAERAPDGRPFVYSNFVLTLDGRATIGGVSGPIGSDRDTEMLVALRKQSDALLIGAGTMRAERYGPVRGRPVAVVSNSFELPWDAELFSEGECRVIVFTTSDAEPPETTAPVEVVRHEGTVDLAAALRHLRSERDVRSLLCEGGPHLHGQLLQAGLVDELFVTRAPKLEGGEGPGLVAGLPASERALTLIGLASEPETGELFTRYRTLETG